MSGSTDSNFAARLLERAAGRSALIDAPSGQSVAPADLAGVVAGFASGFLAAGLQVTDRVVIVCDLSSTSALAYLGAMYAGLVPVPVPESTWATCGEATVKKARATAVWMPVGRAGGSVDRHQVRHLTGRLSGPGAALPAARREDDLAVLMPTSGSTGEPRMVMVTHGNLIANTEAIVRSQGLGQDERAMLILPVSYCFGASVLHTHLYQGGGVVFDSRFMFPDKVLRAISEYGCTTFAGVPTAYNILLRRSNLKTIPLKSLRRFLQAGGPLAAERVHEMRRIVPDVDFFAMYGQTEATSRISCLPPARLRDKCGSAGLPLDNVRIRVVAACGRDAEPGEPGVIWAAGKSICRGYLDDPDASAEKFRGGWLVTGDLGYRDPEGFLWVLGRSGEFIKMRGIRVSFAEVEARIAALPGVHECAAAAVPHAEAGEALALYVVAADGAQGIDGTIRRHLPRQWVCDSVNLVAALPKTAHGKLARALLYRAASGQER
ncbi:MAG: AMP-binding protein [Steroidobacteraceae bacterium]